jgi:hypothetical protein
MSTLSPIHATSVIKFEHLNWVAADPLSPGQNRRVEFIRPVGIGRINSALPRDHSQSQRLHEPKYRINTIDPMTGEDIENVTSHPSLVDGNLTIYFETDATRKSYLDMPLDHPNLHLPYPAAADDDRGG